MEEKTQGSNFIKNIIDEDLASGKHKSIQTRFPPEPNGHLHIGHAKSICLNFGLGEQYGFTTNLRLDDTNPEKESDEYAQAIMRDIEWLGYKWNLFHASDYFDQLYDFAVDLIKEGKAFVCDLNAEQTREYRGTLKEPGKNSPYRERTVEENLDLFARMKAGEFDEGQRVLRAKIDMSHPNINMRDPVIYRIRKVHHQRTGDKWCIYPMYDYTHCLSDALEGITHSLCTLEFEDHRPLYDWFVDNVNVPAKPRQIEFAKLKLDHTVMGKRHLIQMVEEGLVDGWDDPRMPTIAGLRARGYPSSAIKSFCERIGIGKKETVIDFSILEDCVRQELENTSKRVMGVLDPLKVTITNYPSDKEEYIDCPYHPKDESFGSRKVPMSSEIYIDRADFMENAPRKFFRLSNDKEVRLRYSYVIKCNEIIKDDKGEIIELKCTYDPDTMGGKTPDGRKVKGIIHWVSAKHAYSPQVTLYDRLFTVPNPGSGGKDFREVLNKESKISLKSVKLEESLKDSERGETFQFERVGYFTRFEENEFRRTVTLRDTWAKVKNS